MFGISVGITWLWIKNHRRIVLKYMGWPNHTKILPDRTHYTWDMLSSSKPLSDRTYSKLVWSTHQSHYRTVLTVHGYGSIIKAIIGSYLENMGYGPLIKGTIGLYLQYKGYGPLIKTFIGPFLSDCTWPTCWPVRLVCTPPASLDAASLILSNGGTCSQLAKGTTGRNLVPPGVHRVRRSQ